MMRMKRIFENQLKRKSSVSPHSLITYLGSSIIITFFKSHFNKVIEGNKPEHIKGLHNKNQLKLFQRKNHQ